MSQFDIFGGVATPKKALAAALNRNMLTQVAKKHEFHDENTTRVLATITTTATFKPHSMIVHSKFGKPSYSGSLEDSAKYTQSENSLKNLLQESGKNGYYNGYMSPNTRRIVKKRLDNWLTSISENVKFKYLRKEVNHNQINPTFVTLTLPDKQKHKDQTIKDKCFLPFIEWLTNPSQEKDRKGNLKGFGVQCYFWRAETQKNGNVHFHLIIDRFVPFQALRRKWNQFIERLGYITRYRQKMQYIHQDGFALNTKQQMFEVQRLRKFAERFNKTKKVPANLSMKRYSRLIDKMTEAQRLNRKISEETLYEVAAGIMEDAYFRSVSEDWSDPNTTDIKSVDNINSLASYVCKYLAKDAETAPLLENQTIKETNGKKYVVTTTQEDGITFVLSEEEYKPIFLVRKVHGRIWGCSDNLRAKEVDYPKCEIVEEERVWDTDPKAVKRFYNRPLSKDMEGIECVESVKNHTKQVREFVVNDFCKTYSSKEPIKTFFTEPMRKKYILHYQNIHNFLYGQIIT